MNSLLALDNLRRNKRPYSREIQKLFNSYVYDNSSSLYHIYTRLEFRRIEKFAENKNYGQFVTYLK